MAKRTINPVKVRINHDRLEALHSICSDMKQQLQPENDHEQLMQAYLDELYYALCRKLEKDQELYTLNMSGTEAVAFRQLWKILDIKNDKYAGIIVNGILKQIDKYQRDRILS